MNIVVVAIFVTIVIQLNMATARKNYGMYVWTKGFDRNIPGCNEHEFLEWNTKGPCFTHVWNSSEKRQWLWSTCNLAGREVDAIFVSDVHHNLKHAYDTGVCDSGEIAEVKDMLKEGHAKVPNLKIYGLYAVDDQAVSEKDLVKYIVHYNDVCASSEEERFDGVATNNEYYAKLKCGDMAVRLQYLDNLQKIVTEAAKQQHGKLLTHYSMSWHWGQCGGTQSMMTWNGKTSDVNHHMIDIFDSTDVQVGYIIQPQIADRMKKAGIQYAQSLNKKIYTTVYTNKVTIYIQKMSTVKLEVKGHQNGDRKHGFYYKLAFIHRFIGNKFITHPNTEERPCLYVYLVDDHFHAITTITGFFSARYFCDRCLKHYNNKERHQCETKCLVCKHAPCLKTKNPVTCTDCNMVCRSQDCYTRHKKVSGGLNRQRDDDQKEPKSECKTWWKCPTCYKVINRIKRDIKHHQCGEYVCSSCHSYVLDGHLCYLRATPYKLNTPKFIFFDFECSQDERTECDKDYLPDKTGKCQNCQTSWCGKATHRPNFVVAQSACKQCQDLSVNTPCRNCGYRCKHCHDREEGDEKEPCSSECGQREFIFEGDNTLEDFGKWLFSSHHKSFKAIAHNMKGYDGYFLLEYLIDNSMRPDKIIYAGSKIMYMTVEKGLNISVIDSLNFLPMKLADLPKAFDLTELKKGWFPHFFNTRENQQYVGPYPDEKYYGAEFMSMKEREKLMDWLASKTEELFDFRQEMLEYCRSDVDILRRACLTFKNLLWKATRTEAFMKVTKKKNTKWRMVPVGINPFDYTTIASVCMGVYKTKFLTEEWEVRLDNRKKWTPARYVDGNLEILKDDKWIKEGNLTKVKITGRRFLKSPIAKVPTVRKNQFSKASIQWLEWMAKRDNAHIQHALNGGEKTLPGRRYKLDGYCAETNTAYEYHGCVFHGCPKCFPDETTVHPLTKQSMRELYVVTQKKKTYIESQGMKYKCVWEHEFLEQCQQHQDLKDFIETLDVTDRMDPRDSFFGGRTNASQLYYKASEGEHVKYVDFTSLYPWVNKYCEYPVGHPEIITQDFKDLTPYFGIAKVKILPPRGLYHPVLPYRSNGKLKFPLCRSCADTENPNPCTCSDDQRALTGTWCTPELETAVRLGYRILHIYEVYHWAETNKYDTTTRQEGLFANYINTFLKFKQEASGPPDWIETEEDVEKYIDDYLEKEGVQMTKDNITKNPGLRALAKLCLNSFWGKFGQRLNLRQTGFFHQSEVDLFFQTFTDPTKQPQNFHIVTEDIIQLEWTYGKDCLPEDNKTNIYLATFTTCWARLKLYSVLESLDRRVLYYDTDSIIYVSRPGQFDPPLGDYLGELTNELDAGEQIVEFVSGGPKNYAYKTNTNKETCKVRGFTLNYTNSQLINFESVKEIVTDPQSYPKITVTNPNKICRDKRKRKLFNRPEEKTYQMVYTKRRRIDNFDTEPYGF